MLSDREIEGLDLHNMTDEQARLLCGRIREHLIHTISNTGGHLASNLGAVELTIAMHRVFDFQRDRLIFDVGHQCYTHKILTGRADAMSGLRSFGGIAGFPKPAESDTDAFIAGHASNSVSVALGMSRARTMAGEDYHVLALIGDGALTGGLAYEGLSNAGQSGEQIIVILNDNGMSITQNVGGVAQYLSRQRLKPQYLSFKVWYRRVTARTRFGRAIYSFTHKLKKAAKATMLPCSMFEDMGFTYLGPVDGHDTAQLTKILRYAKSIGGPVLLHARTVKGKGYTHAEETPKNYHGVSAFNVDTGEARKASGCSFSEVFGRTLCRIAQQDDRVCAITAAMQSGTGLDAFAARFPDRFFDVGIAEGHGVAMAGGLAKQGMIPVFAVYSTFLQRGYDMLLHDIALQGLHAVFCVDRAGLVGDDGETHHGVFDVSFLDSIPGMTVLAPASFAELEQMLEDAVLRYTGPVAIRYPRGGEGCYTENNAQASCAILREGTDVTLVAYGKLISNVLEAAELLQEQGINAHVVKINILTPFDSSAVLPFAARTGAILVVEDSIEKGGVGQRLCVDLARNRVQAKIALCTSGDRFVTHGSVKQLETMLGLDPEGIARQAKELLSHGEGAS